MRERGSGHIINISTIGLQTNTPRFSAYLASKAALDAFSRSIAAEIIDDGVHITTVYMPLVRTPMIAPTKIYDRFPTLSPEEAAEMITDAIRKRPKRVATMLGNLGQLSYAVAPGAQDLVVNRAYKLFPESERKDEKETPEQRAFVRATRGVHW
jgi:short-subunit dehydrogenase